MPAVCWDLLAHVLAFKFFVFIYAYTVLFTVILNKFPFMFFMHILFIQQFDYHSHDHIVYIRIQFDCCREIFQKLKIFERKKTVEGHTLATVTHKQHTQMITMQKSDAVETFCRSLTLIKLLDYKKRQCHII